MAITLPGSVDSTFTFMIPMKSHVTFKPSMALLSYLSEKGSKVTYKVLA